jgi:short-subunit dehydrogenase
MALAEELRGSKIKVGLVSPGPVNTAFIMSDMNKVSDITFSQPMSTAEEVAQTILDLCGNNITEKTMPAISGILATLSYLMPWVGRQMRPMLERKGQRVKKKLKAEQKRRESDSPDR